MLTTTPGTLTEDSEILTLSCPSLISSLFVTAIETGKSKLFVSMRVAVTTVGASCLTSSARAKDEVNKESKSNRIFICNCEAVY